jgi:autotransporter-associated beta strand protein
MTGFDLTFDGDGQVSTDLSDDFKTLLNANVRVKPFFSGDMAQAIPFNQDLNILNGIIFNNINASAAEGNSNIYNKTADLSVVDGRLGGNTLRLSSNNPNNFESIGSSLLLKTDTTLNHEAKQAFDVNINATIPVSTGLNALFNETGKIYLSVDGNGTTGSNGFVQVLKNPNAVVRKAYLVGDGTNEVGTSAFVNNKKVTWDRIESTPGSINFHSYFSDVTSVVKSTIDAAAAGTINMAVGEGSESSAYEGLALAVVFDDPNQRVEQSVILYFGGLRPTGGTAKINFASPINTNSTLGATLGLGIGYSFNAGTNSSQSSQVKVNGQLLTSVAGNFDDGIGVNGALFTVGGVGDSNSNPSPSSTDITTDDELYNLLPFIRNGDTSLTLNTINPSNDDHIFFAHLTLQGITGTDSTNVVKLAVEPAVINENGSRQLIYTFTRTGTLTNPLTVNYNVGGTATFATDYTQTGANKFTRTNGEVVFAANSATAIVKITAKPDTIPEIRETVILTLTTGSTYAIGTSNPIVGTILDQSAVRNLPPTAIIFKNTISAIAEDINTTNRIKIADLTIVDDALGTNVLSLSGTDAASFELSGSALFLKAGKTLDFLAKPSFNLVVNVDDATVGNTPDVSVNFQLAVTGGKSLHLSGSNNLDVGSTGSLRNSPFAANPSNINLTGNEINLIGGNSSLFSSGNVLRIQPFSINQNIQIGGADSGSSSILDITSTDLAAIANGFRKIIFGRANGSGTISIVAPVSFRDPTLLQSPNGQLNINAPITLTDNATLDFNVKTLVKSGPSILTINGSIATTFIGNTIVNGGTLELAKTINIDALNNSPITINGGALKLSNSEQINNGADLTLNGGRLELNGFNESLDLLKVSSNSAIDFGNSSSDLTFGNSSTQAWQGILTIQNWSNATGEKLRFGSNASGLTAAQLQSIQFVGFSKGAKIDSAGFVTPITTTTTNGITAMAALQNRTAGAGAASNSINELLDLRSFTAGQNIQVTFTLQREAAYHNTVGFYRIEDAQGTVTSITGAKLQPGQAGYGAAVIQKRIAGLDLSVANGQTISVTKTLQGGAMYAPFLVTNGHPNSLHDNFSNLYTPYLLGNGDATDHIQLLGQNTFGFEDMVGGGDQDFNDMVVKAAFSVN